MKAEELDAALAAIPVRPVTIVPAAPRAPARPAVSQLPPLEALVRRALQHAETLPVGETCADRRKPEAIAIRGRLPSFLATAKPDDLRARVRDVRLKKAALGWSWGDGGLLLLGRTGIGKSSAAAWLFRRLLRMGWEGGGAPWARAQGLRWCSADDLARARGEHGLGRGEAPAVEIAERTELLFLDDLGWDRDPAVVSSVLHARYEAQRPTIATSGRTVDELVATYGAAVMRRLNDAGGRGSMTIVDCFGGSGA